MNGLFIMRQIDPSPDLSAALENLDQIVTLDDGTHWVDDARPRDSELNEEIAGGMSAGGRPFDGCTVGFGIFDEDWRIHARYRALDRAQAALKGAKVQFVADIDVESDEPVGKYKGVNHPDIITDAE